ncbi:MAG: chemotaxis protein CheA [Lachnospiraceae bacterium]|nr:chemotaxis protein CheA [Lachnospiraceae bacterium]
MDVSQYLEIFIDETKEHLQSLNEHILVIEKEPENVDTINEIFRAAHSLKGMAGTMGFKRMQRLTHDMENVFSEVRNGKMTVTADLVDTLFKCLDALEEYLTNIQETAEEGTEDNEEIIAALNKAVEVGTGEQPAEKTETKQEKSEAKASSDGEKDEENRKYKQLVLADFEKHAVQEAKEKGMHIFGITVFIQETCLLKAARAFLVFKALEEMGEIIKSVPAVQDIEDEKFEFDFSVIYITKEDIEKVKAAILNVSEIQSAFMEELTVEAEAKQEVKQEETQQVANAPQTASKPKEKPQTKTSKPVVNRSVRVDIEKLDVLMNLVSELIIAKNGLVSASTHDANQGTQGFNEQIEYLERITTNLHESVMKVRMMPIETVVNKFPRMIRDLTKKLDKKMELYMSGEDTELDRTVIDEIGDPLMHLLRNAADHGLESNEERERLGKPSVGSIFLNAYQDGNNVVIEVRDDGKGINTEAVKNSAIKKGVITPEQAENLNEQEIIGLLFRPAFSTAEKVSDVSGRGVGLDVVKNNIETLGGDIEVTTKLGEGSTFTIRLPLTLAIIQALMVELGDEKYAIPLNSIQTIEDVNISDIKYVQTKEVINLRGSVIPLIRLDQVLDCPPKEEEPENLTVVIVSKGDKQAGLVVDNLMGQQEIVIKPLGKYINIHKIISGATILGDGEVALILDANALV